MSPSDDPWQDQDQSWRDAWRWFFLSYLQSFAADGDGPPSWFWPSVLLASVTGLAFIGLRVSKDHTAYIQFILPWYAGFCATDIGLWLGYNGWKHHVAKRATPTVPTTTVSTVTDTHVATTETPKP